METINLIPKEERVQQTKTKVVKASTILSLIVLVIVGGIGGYFYYKTSSLKDEIKVKEDSISGLRVDINKLTEIEIESRNLYKKSSVLAHIFKSRLYYSKMLEELEKSIPTGVGIRTFGLNKDRLVSISGRAETYNQVQDFSNMLLERPLFTEVTLNSVGLESNKEGIGFFIAVSYSEELLYE